ncbi:alpha/beta hydrolase [Nocardia sp. NPDC051756]|uniref:alpha/beta hydrolase n=1 Tax=Nocardia sp. NPDC051756 TaxID=3154751 RepID=UPI003437ED81
MADNASGVTKYRRLSRRSWVIEQGFRYTIRPVLRRIPITAWSIRVAGAIDAATVIPRPAGVTLHPVSLAGFDAELVQPVGYSTQLREGAVLYLHGGAFVLGGLNTHRRVVAALARRSGLPVLHVAYRQLPDTTIRGSVNDAVTAYQWLLRNGADPGRVIFAGDSAGGFLVFAAALTAQQTGIPAPAGLIGISPWLDLDCTTKIAHPNNHTDAYLPATLLAAISELGTETDHAVEQTLSPVSSALAGLPPVLLIAVTSEVLRVDAELMHRRLTAAGVPSRLQLWDGQVHAFTTVFPSLPESRAALDDCAQFIRAQLNLQPSLDHTGS